MGSRKGYALLIGGVSGCGKSTVARRWADRAGAAFVEGDSLHSPASVEKMRAGIALDDADRIEWLGRVAQTVDRHRGPVAPVVSCSALKRAYRDLLRRDIEGLRIVMLDVPYSVALERVGSRTGHYMPPSLVSSQFSTLERPVGEPATALIDGCRPVVDLLDDIDRWLASGEA